MATTEFLQEIRTDAAPRFHRPLGSEESGLSGGITFNGDRIVSGREVFDEMVLPSPTLEATSGTEISLQIDSQPNSAGFPEQKVSVPQFVRRNRSSPPSRSFEVLQQWEGIVTSVEPDTFWANLRDLSVPSNPVESVELPRSEIGDEDSALLTIGSVFYWIIGYERSPKGSIRRVSEFRLRRTPLWSKRELEAAKREGEKLFKLMNDGHHAAT